jgi:hypothetical protein
MEGESRTACPVLTDSRSLSDFSDYDSSEDEYQARRSRRQSFAKPARQEPAYRSLEEEGGVGRKGLLDPNDPFGDPFADDIETPVQERQRMNCESSPGVNLANMQGPRSKCNVQIRV